MNGASAVRGGWVVRFMLLALTLLGLAAMHSLGHQPAMPGGHAGSVMPDGQPGSVGPDDGAGSSMTANNRSVVPPAAEERMEPVGVWSITLVGECRSGGCARLVPRPDRSPEHMPGWAVCMAVVGGFGLALALAVALLVGRATTSPSSRHRPSVTASRDPPAAPLAGQRVAAISVLRI